VWDEQIEVICGTHIRTNVGRKCPANQRTIDHPHHVIKVKFLHPSMDDLTSGMMRCSYQLLNERFDFCHLIELTGLAHGKE
jgi:hypothetical protein